MKLALIYLFLALVLPALLWILYVMSGSGFRFHIEDIVYSIGWAGVFLFATGVIPFWWGILFVSWLGKRSLESEAEEK